MICFAKPRLARIVTTPFRGAVTRRAVRETRSDYAAAGVPRTVAARSRITSSTA